MLRHLLFAALCSAVALPATAQIKIGQTAGFTGTVASTVKEVTDGAKLYLDWTNSHGGVNGQAIELVSLDDGFDAKRTVENAKKLIADPNVVALFLSRGTSHSEALMPVLSEGKITLIAPSTGSMSLHRPVHPWIFNVRAPYQREAERAVRHLSLIGMDRIAVIQADDSFGADVVTGAQKGFVAVDKKAVLIEKFDRSKPNFDEIAPKVVKAEAQGVLFIGSGDEVANGAAALRAAGSRAQIVTLSNNASTGFVKSLKDNARGTIVSQVFPYERSMSAAIVKEAHEIAAAKGIMDVTPAMLEGYAGAKVLVEALKRAGPAPSRQKIQQALESFRRVDIGGLEVSFSNTDHTGLDYADLSIIGPDGKFRR